MEKAVSILHSLLLPVWPQIRAIAVDLDGTVLTSKPALSEGVRTSLQAVLTSGREVIICTGRSPASAEPYRKAIGAEGPMVFWNGAIVAQTPGLQPIHQYTLDSAALLPVFDYAYYKKIYLHCFTEDGNLYCQEPLPEREIYFQRTGLYAKATDMQELLSSAQGGPVVKAMAIAEPEVLTKLEAKIRQLTGDAFYLTRSQYNFLEILAHKANKGAGLTKVMALRNLKPSQVIAFGDGENDIPLLQAVDWPVAMAGGSPLLPPYALGTAPSADEDGLAQVLQALLYR